MLAAPVVPRWRWHCIEKRRFGHVETAQEALLSLAAAKATHEVAFKVGVLCVYGCPDCGFWHVGHDTRWHDR